MDHFAPSSFIERATGLERIAREEGGDKALATARALLDEADRVPPDMPHARAANRLGAFLSDRSFDAEARRALNAAEALLQRSGESDDALLASIHNNIGQLEMRAGDLEAAEQRLEAALALREADPGHDDAAMNAFTADNLAAVLAHRGLLDRAEALHRQALQTLQALGPRYAAHVATVYGNLGLLYRRRGDVPRARAHLLRAIDTHLSLGTLQTSDARIPLVNLIALMLESGREREADEMIDWLLRADGDDAVQRNQLGHALLELGRGAFLRAQLGAAERIVARSLSLLEASAGGAGEPELRAAQLLANVHAAKGNYESAEQGLLRVLQAGHHQPAQAAELLIDLSKSVRQRGKGSHATARTMLERALALLRQPGTKAQPGLVVSALGNLGYLQFLGDDMAGAEALYGQALALGDAKTLGNEYPWLLYNRALLAYHRADYGAARDGMREALRLWQRSLGSRHAFVAIVHANLALVQWSRGDFAAARREFAAAHTLRAADFQRTLLVGSEQQRLQAANEHLDDLYKLLSCCFAAGARGALARLAAELLLQRKACVLDAMATTQARIRERLDDASRVKLDRLAELNARIAERALSERLFDGGDARSELPALKAEADRLQAELSHAGAVGVMVPDPVALAAVQAALPAATVLIEYLRWSAFEPVRTGQWNTWAGERYAAMVLRRRGEPRWFDLGDAASIDSSVDSLLALTRDAEGDADAASSAAQQLYGRIVGPFESLIEGAALLHVAPDGALNLLPFGVLGEPMLGERCVVNHLTSGRELVQTQQPAGADAEVVAIVDPDYDAAAATPGAPTLDLPALPRTRDEARLVESLFPHCRVLAGSSASVAALKATARPALLHVATHGLFSRVVEGPPLQRSELLQVGDELMILQQASKPPAADPMLHAGLALAGANRGAAGFASAAELAGLDLRGTELAVLSACDTGLGAAAHGGEFAGLRRALSIAGAATQLITLWAVDDDAAVDLMRAYYRRLIAGMGRAEALQQAQIELKRRPRWAHPSAWGAFVAYGAAGPLSEALRARAKEGAR